MIYCNVVINEGCMQNFSILCWKLPPKKLKNWFFQWSAAKKFQNLKILLKKKFWAKKINYIRLIYGVDGCFMQKNFKIGGHNQTLCGFLGLRRRISKNFENWIFSKIFFLFIFCHLSDNFSSSKFFSQTKNTCPNFTFKFLQNQPFFTFFNPLSRKWPKMGHFLVWKKNFFSKVCLNWPKNRP